MRLLVAGWCADPRSPNTNGNYVAVLKTDDDVEIDRRSTPNGLGFVPVLLDGSGYKGKRVYLEAVDNADQDAYSMFAIDDVRAVAFPPTRRNRSNRCFRLTRKTRSNWRTSSTLSRWRESAASSGDILDKTAKVELIREPRLADNFKFTLPVPGKEPWETREANYVLGRDQTLSSSELREQSLTLRWQGPLRGREGEKYDAAVTMVIKLVDQSIQFSLQVANRTPYSVGEVWFPLLGGVTGVGDQYRDLKSTQLVRKTATGIVSSDIFFVFPNVNELGDQGPEQYYSYPGDLSEPWVELTNKRLRPRRVLRLPRPRRSLTGAAPGVASGNCRNASLGRELAATPGTRRATSRCPLFVCRLRESAAGQEV